jgi:hypothetical protein
MNLPGQVKPARPRLKIEDDDDDAVLSTIHRIDVVNNPMNSFAQNKLTIIRNESQPTMEIITKDGSTITRLKASSAPYGVVGEFSAVAAKPAAPPGTRLAEHGLLPAAAQRPREYGRFGGADIMQMAMAALKTPVLDAAQPDTPFKTPLVVSSLAALEGGALLLGLGAWQQSLQWRRAFVNS